MATLTGRYPKDTYGGLLNVDNSNSGIDATLRSIQDGLGTNLPMTVSTAAVNFTSDSLQLSGTAATASGLLKHEVGGLQTNISAVADGDFIVGTGTGTLGLESGATVRTSLGLGTAAVKNTGTSGDAVPLLDQANTWSAAQTFTAASLVISSTDAAAGPFPIIDLYHNSASPADYDFAPEFQFNMNNDAAAKVTFAKLHVFAGDVSSGSEDGTMQIQTIVAGGFNTTMGIGPGVSFGAPTGGTPATRGHINATQYKLNGSVMPFQRSFLSSQQIIAQAGQLVLAHGLGSVYQPVVLKCKNGSGANGYANLEVVAINPMMNSGSVANIRGQSIVWDATNITVRFANTSPPYRVINKSTGDEEDAAIADWNFMVMLADV